MVVDGPAAAVAPHALTFLIVEDEPTLREFLTESLRHEGHRTFEAADGRAALQLAAGRPIDVVLLEVQLAGRARRLPAAARPRPSRPDQNGERLPVARHA